MKTRRSKSSAKEAPAEPLIRMAFAKIDLIDLRSAWQDLARGKTYEELSSPAHKAMFGIAATITRKLETQSPEDAARPEMWLEARAIAFALVASFCCSHMRSDRRFCNVGYQISKNSDVMRQLSAVGAIHH